MTYFLKKKKWMAWVVLLTFLFTSFMPSNLLAGNSVAEAKISGPTTVAVGETITLTSDKGFPNHSWSSNKSKVATVSGNGRTATVEGVSAGDVTITHTYTSLKGSQSSETYNVTVTAAGAEKALFYYLKTPTSDPASNDTNQWGPHIGDGTIDVNGATWQDEGKNSYNNVENRVVNWPNGFTNGVVPKENNNWQTIFDAFKSSVEKDYPGVKITEENVEAIILHPYKISKGNGTNPDFHVDCTVEIKVKNIYTATYYLWDAGDTGYQWKYAENVKAGDMTSPKDPVSNLPDTKVVDGKTYYLISWYDNTDLTGEKATFPYTPTDNVNFYAKYVEKYSVSYDLAGGTGDVPARTLYAVDATVNVTNVVPTKQGYTFAGWKSSVNNMTIYQSSESFAMPAQDVVLTAQWTPATDTPYTVEHYLFSKTAHDYVLAPENLDPLLTGIDRKNGTTGDNGTYNSKTFSGWTYDEEATRCYSVKGDNATEVSSPTILADGSLVIRLYYDLTPYHVTYSYIGDVPTNAPHEPVDNATYYLNDTVTVKADPSLAGYTFHGWTAAGVDANAASFTMPASDVELVGSWTANTDTAYTVKHWQQDLNADTYTEVEADRETLHGTTGDQTAAEANKIGRAHV